VSLPNEEVGTARVDISQRPDAIRVTLRYRKRALVLGWIFAISSCSVFVILLTTLLVYSGAPDGKTPPVAMWIGLGTAGGVAIITIMAFSITREDYHAGMRLIEINEESAHLAEKVDEAKDLSTILNLNRSLIAKYHDLSTGQARNAFRAAQIVMLASAVILVAACAMSLLGDAPTGIGIAAVGALGSAIGGYVASTFLRSYEVSVRQAEAYFREPMVAGYLLAAERIARDVMEKDGESDRLSMVIRGFLDSAVELARNQSTSSTD